MIRFTFDGCLPTSIDDLSGLDYGRLNIGTEGLHDLGPLGIEFLTDDELVLLTALGASVAGSEKDALFSLGSSESRRVDGLTVLGEERLGDLVVPGEHVVLNELQGFDGEVVACAATFDHRSLDGGCARSERKDGCYFHQIGRAHV